jgi:hypothetical protein
LRANANALELKGDDAVYRPLPIFSGANHKCAVCGCRGENAARVRESTIGDTASIARALDGRASEAGHERAKCTE